MQLALPFILIALTFAAILGADMWKLILFMAIAQWVQYARVMRGTVLTLREREFVQSARAYGLRDHVILLRHVLPNAIGPVIVLVTLNVANNILLESSLTFLGLGIDPLTPSWGGMLADGRSYLQSAWWVGVFPGARDHADGARAQPARRLAARRARPDFGHARLKRRRVDADVT